ncbi:unnamed protein product [Effrenium voratum]|uniref:Uncharacterized protein n=1 Tax=Effrenium voratum TaxID=2562239 RepID=A0AA36JA06_9DINO|nr:unnamed protein product [Effrenium voratum]CAJ1413745.1 unnamed protein product [Effrenium voratum]|eukprot:CAMPEP_0181442544 /NCGR_PEP_ID=MMETSP1110-20121109/24082_1 /TAXON_ID=174948 /ORGANISM="Symbiodinium sp., Strain CCMP421" /LENGTH=97 /DNA_ID=CAMNT_0023566471 /DNA_START=83 /DNA_END=376 /DNA_ORIENTATION=-
MARRASFLLSAICLVSALWLLSGTCFVAPQKLAEAPKIQAEAAAAPVALAALVAAVPEAAYAGNSGYALLQLGWAIFIISLGPAVLFWIYFNKPELL